MTPPANLTPSLPLLPSPSSSTASTPTPLRPLHARLILVAAVFVVMGRLIFCDFTWWDDQMTVHQNRQMQQVGLDTFVDNWKHPTAAIYIPLTYTLWGLVALVARVQPDPYGINLNPWFFHGTNVLVHAGGALAAWALLRRLVRNDGAALLGALLWAVHPVQVESVGWVSGLKDVLSGSLVLASMAAYVHWRQENGGMGRRATGWSRYALALALYVLAMLAKPSAFTEPLLLIAIDRGLLRTPWRDVAKALAPFAAVTVPVALVARLAQPGLAVESPVWLRPLVVGDALAFYALKVLAPVHLAYDYGRNIPAIRRSGAIWFTWLLPAAVTVGLFVLYRVRRRRERPLSPVVAVSALLFALAPLHVLGLSKFDFQFISTVADHYLYVAMIGPALLLAWAVADRPRAWTRALMGTAVVLVVAYGARAAWQTPVWQDELTLDTHTAAVNPDSWTSYINRGAFRNQLGDRSDERTNLLMARKLQPLDVYSRVGLLDLSLQTGDHADAPVYAGEIIDLYRRFGASPDAVATGYVKVANAYADVGRLDEAERYFREALAVVPNSTTLKQRLQQIQWQRQSTRPSS